MLREAKVVGIGGLAPANQARLVELALRLSLHSKRKREKIVALPSFRTGGALVDITDRDALYQAMEGR